MIIIRSVCLITIPEVAGSIPGTSTILKVNWVLRTIGQLFDWEVRIRLGKSTLIDLTKRNNNHITSSYCHWAVSCRSLVDRCGSLGSCKPQIKIDQIILTFVTDGCEASPYTKGGRVFENRNLRRKFEDKRDENGEWRRLYNEELNTLYRSPNIARVIKSRRMRWTGHLTRMEKSRSAFKI